MTRYRRRPMWSNRTRRNTDLDRQLTGQGWAGFYDPTGIHYGIPTYPYRSAPTDLATRRQLRAAGLCPGGHEPVAQILWRKGTRVAYLYRLDLARPKREATDAQMQAVLKALVARCTCRTCGITKPYYIPRRHGCCWTCAGHPDMDGAA